MKDSEYFEQQAERHRVAAANQSLEGWVRNANARSALDCRRQVLEAREIEEAEEAVAVALAATGDEGAPGNPWDALEAAERHLDALVTAREAHYE